MCSSDLCCNRTACQKRGANWWNVGTRAWYCFSCAQLINNGLPEEEPLCFRPFNPYTPFPGDHEHVILLLERGRDLFVLGQGDNARAALMKEMAWSFALAAAYLRCSLKGELDPTPRSMVRTSLAA